MMSMRTGWVAASLACLLAVGCAGEGAGPESSMADPDERFLVDGRSDALFGVEDGSADAEGVLLLVNTASQRELDDDVRLDRRAAENIVTERTVSGAFQTLEELDAVAWVGRRAFGKLLEYARENGFVQPAQPPQPDGGRAPQVWCPSQLPAASMTDIVSEFRTHSRSRGLSDRAYELLDLIVTNDRNRYEGAAALPYPPAEPSLWTKQTVVSPRHGRGHFVLPEGLRSLDVFEPHVGVNTNSDWRSLEELQHRHFQSLLSKLDADKTDGGLSLRELLHGAGQIDRFEEGEQAALHMLIQYLADPEQYGDHVTRKTRTVMVAGRDGLPRTYEVFVDERFDLYRLDSACEVVTGKAGAMNGVQRFSIMPALHWLTASQRGTLIQFLDKVQASGAFDSPCSRGSSLDTVKYELQEARQTLLDERASLMELRDSVGEPGTRYNTASADVVEAEKRRIQAELIDPVELAIDDVELAIEAVPVEGADPGAMERLRSRLETDIRLTAELTTDAWFDHGPRVVTEYERHRRQDGTWQESAYRTHYEYDAAGYLSQTVRERKKDTGWEEFRRVYLEYGSGEFSRTTDGLLWDGTWRLSSRHTSCMDADGRVTVRYMQGWRQDRQAWAEPGRRYNYWFDDDGEMYRENIFKAVRDESSGDAEEWVKTFFRSYDYDDQGRMIRRTSFDCSETWGCEHTRTHRFGYDAEGRLTQRRGYSITYDGTSTRIASTNWGQSSKTTFEFDVQGRLVRKLRQSFDEQGEVRKEEELLIEPTNDGSSKTWQLRSPPMVESILDLWGHGAPLQRY